MVMPTIRKKRPVPQTGTNTGAHLPAPVGGINALDPAAAMPITDCLSLYNMIPYQYGLRVRSGWREWATNVGTDRTGLGMLDDGSPMMFHMAAPLGGEVVGGWPGIAQDGVRTIIAFYGKNPSGDRLFACTPDGIYDCTESTSAPTKVYTYPYGVYTDQYGNPVSVEGAGVMSYTAFVNANGDHYIAACDGANGYLLYSEKDDEWTKVEQGTATGQIDGANPGAFRFVMSWKNRLWFASEDSSIGYYLPVNQFAGEVNKVYFGSRFRYGGSLVGLYSWTVDGGTGIDDLLVAVSRGGDVVIYRGTDPAFAETFGLVGVWWIGQIPPGRTIASDFGGDLFILSRLGCLPLSKLVSGGLIRDPNIYATAKIANLFNTLMTERGHLYGWSVKMHPSDNLLVVNVPATPDKPGQQLAMSLANKGWAQLSGIPMMCMEAWRGSLYFGTEDGRVCVNDGYSDGAALDGTGAYAIYCSLITAYNAMGSAKKKRVHMIKPYFSTDGSKPGYTVGARYDYDLSDVGALPPPPASSANHWGTGRWGTALWGPPHGTESRIKGATGIGTTVAFVLQFNAKSNTTLVGFDAIVDQGGLR